LKSRSRNLPTDLPAPKSTTAFQFDIQDLTKSALMGSAPALSGYVPYQLALPFVYPDTIL